MFLVPDELQRIQGPQRMSAMQGSRKALSCLPKVLLRMRVEMQGPGVICGCGGVFGVGCHDHRGWFSWWRLPPWDDHVEGGAGVPGGADFFLQQPRGNRLTAGR